MRCHKYKIIVLLYIMTLLSACFGGGNSDPIRYYLIDPTNYSTASLTAVRPLTIEIIDLHIPQYLERFHIATRSNESQLEFSEYHQWGENLRKNLLRTTARNLSKLLSTIDIGTPLNRTSSLPDYRLQIHVEQFEQGTDNRIRLVVRWQLSGSDQTDSLGVFEAELESQEIIEKGNYDQMVLVMREQFGELNKRIAESILAQEK